MTVAVASIISTTTTRSCLRSSFRQSLLLFPTSSSASVSSTPTIRSLPTAYIAISPTFSLPIDPLYAHRMVSTTTAMAAVVSPTMRVISDATSTAEPWNTSTGSHRNNSSSVLVQSDVEMIAANHRQLQKQRDNTKNDTTTMHHSSSDSTSHCSRSYSFRSPNLAKPTLKMPSTATNPQHRSFSVKHHEASSSPPSSPSYSAATSKSSNAARSVMKDEYGIMDDSGFTYIYPGDFLLESGELLPSAQLRYQTYGQLNPKTSDNVLVVCHALTGNASLHSWWGDLLGPGCVFDTDQYFVVCCNILGSCYGSSSPVSINPITGQRYGLDFPDVSVKDTVRLMLHMLQDELHVASVKSVIGGSFGGMQALEFAVQAGSIRLEGDGDGDDDDNGGYHANLADQGAFTDVNGNPYVRSVVPIACGAQHTAWQIAISEVQRQAIYKDPAWIDGNHFGATQGLEIARQMGMITYRTHAAYGAKFGRKLQGHNNNSNNNNKSSNNNNNNNNSSSSHNSGDGGGGPLYGRYASWQVKSYLEYQGQKFVSRFDPVSYVKMTEQMDSHDVSRGRYGTVSQVLARVHIPALILGIASDVLYPLEEQQQLAKLLPRSTLHIIDSSDGHDGFLLAQDQVAAHMTNFFQQHA